MVTQTDIARRVGLDVSSVNKILNRRPRLAFKKETIKRVFKVARQLGYDLGRLKHEHRRRHPRKDVALAIELTVYKKDGTLFDRGTAIIKNVSLSGTLLGAIVLPRRSLPAELHTIGLRVLEGPLKDVEVLGRPVRLSYRDGGFHVAIEFLGTEEAKANRLLSVRA